MSSVIRTERIESWVRQPGFRSTLSTYQLHELRLFTFTIRCLSFFLCKMGIIIGLMQGITECVHMYQSNNKCLSKYWHMLTARYMLIYITDYYCFIISIISVLLSELFIMHLIYGFKITSLPLLDDYISIRDTTFMCRSPKLTTSGSCLITPSPIILWVLSGMFLPWELSFPGPWCYISAVTPAGCEWE